MSRGVKFSLIGLLLVFAFQPLISFAGNVEVDFFYGDSCPACDQEAVFLNQLALDYPDIIINDYDLTQEENRQILVNFYLKHQVPDHQYGLMPATFITGGSDHLSYFIGYKPGMDEFIADYIGKLIDDGEAQVENFQINQPTENDLDFNSGSWSISAQRVIATVVFCLLVFFMFFINRRRLIAKNQ